MKQAVGGMLGAMEFPWPIDQATWLVRRAARLAELGAEPVGALVLPTGAFFPDKMDGSEASYQRLWDRLRGHVGLSELETEVLLVDPDANQIVSSCSSGGCGTGLSSWSGERVSPRADGSYAIHLAMPELKHPTVITTALSRAVGEVFLREADALRAFGAKERPAIIDLAASMLGLAVLVANGSGIEVKGCGGVKVQSVTSFTTPLATLAVALVERREVLRKRRAEDATPLDASLDNVARSMFGVARAFVRANDDVVRRLDDAPAGLIDGTFSLREPRDSPLTRLRRALGFGRTSDDPIENLERELAAGVAPKAMTGKARPRRADAAEIRALVDESFE